MIRLLQLERSKHSLCWLCSPPSSSSVRCLSSYCWSGTDDSPRCGTLLDAVRRLDLHRCQPEWSHADHLVGSRPKQ